MQLDYIYICNYRYIIYIYTIYIYYIYIVYTYTSSMSIVYYVKKKKKKRRNIIIKHMVKDADQHEANSRNRNGWVAKGGHV